MISEPDGPRLLDQRGSLAKGMNLRIRPVGCGSAAEARTEMLEAQGYEVYRYEIDAYSLARGVLVLRLKGHVCRKLATIESAIVSGARAETRYSMPRKTRL